MTTRKLLTTMAMRGAAAIMISMGAAWAQEPERGGDEQIRRIIQRGLDEAFQNQVEHLFSNWMKDEHQQPARAANGIRRAVRAYRHAIAAIDTERIGRLPPLPRPREVSK
jgi:hypothetical protein